MNICAHCIGAVMNNPNRYRLDEGDGNGPGMVTMNRLAEVIEQYATEEQDRPRIIDSESGRPDWAFGTVLPLRAVTTINGVPACVACVSYRGLWAPNPRSPW